MKHNYSTYSDKELYHMMGGAKPESESAFSELYGRYSQRVYAYCLRVLGNTEDAMDVFQEAFLNFFKSSENHLKMDNVTAFLLTIARNLCINHKRDKRPTLNIEDFQFFSNEKKYEDKELLQLVSTALEVLDFDYREAFVLRLYHGLSYKEIADIQSDTVSAVRNRVWRAKEKIKNILSPYLEDLSNN